MAEALIETTNLRKTYLTRRGRQVAVNGLDLRVEAGGVHGFLGPNGSGKTTTIRMVLGLARPDSGTVRLLGQPVPTRLADVIDRVGAVVEQPRLFGGFTGRVNLNLLAKSVGLGPDRVDEVLDWVGMSARADDRYKAYSLGMKQRLAIAGALLKKPQLLVLDEPTNGLDPAGIHQIRDLVRRLAADGTTVLISSHILAEVQQVCDSVSIIGRGKALASGPVADVLRSAGATNAYRVQVPDTGAAAALLTDAGFLVQTVETVHSAHPGEADAPRARDGMTVPEGRHAGGGGAPGTLQVSGLSDPAQITRVLAEHGVYLSGLAAVGGDLESAFLQITEGQGL